jgi:hypothetical protein
MPDNKFTAQRFQQILQAAKPYLLDIEQLIHKVPFGEITLTIKTYGGHVRGIKYHSESEVKYEIPKDIYEKIKEETEKKGTKFA